MIKTWSYVEEYKDLRKKILHFIDKTLKSGEIEKIDTLYCKDRL